ncbi:hypothetical protein SDC9_05899 [bioreactor metagenome]|uniref:Uncharacterized protein n=1 Tax=bioreactor metagenome TaxID=1076179 RepID=A0A644T065_9ZZZZ|nr:hypothetical protein [Negativicutes bacterium]
MKPDLKAIADRYEIIDILGESESTRSSGAIAKRRRLGSQVYLSDMW